MTTKREKEDPFSTNPVRLGDRRVLLLNASEEPLGLIPWQRAASLFVSGKAAKPYNYDHHYEIATTRGDTFRLPAAVMLVEYVRVPQRKAHVTKANVLRRDRYVCQYCGTNVSKSSGTIDHILPQSRGGKNTWTNLTTSCYKCNCKKGNRTPKEAGMKLASEPKAPEIDVVRLRAVDHQENAIWDRWFALEKEYA